MVATRNRGRGKSEENGSEVAVKNGNSRVSYEQIRDQRIKENKERLQKLGILDLSLKLKSATAPPKRPPRDPSDKPKTQKRLSISGSPRRSSRLKTVDPVSYAERRPKEKRKSSGSVEIRIKEGPQPEIYTEEHEKMLGDCVQSWTLGVDGYGEDRKRQYDGVNGETCHQCRQKTLGLHTHCCKCDLVQGQFCGDCLYMRYGENVIEANQNPDWICPVCRGICNCSLCRQAKGWGPTGNLYRKVLKLGYKSVAHYLIQTRRSQPHSETSGKALDASKDVNANDVSDVDVVAGGGGEANENRRSARVKRKLT